MTKRGHWIKYSSGGRGNDDLKGSAGRDLIAGRQGDDSIDGGAGNDILLGDDVFGGKFWGCRFGGWWHAKAGGNDYLDGGAGSDLVLAGRGNDFANFGWSQNLKSHDFYDGGKGFDTLKLTLTHGEARLASVQKDIADFECFLARKANPHSDHGKTFEFKSFNLDARNFEALQVNLVNTGPTARADAVAAGEDAPLVISAPGVLANDTDPDRLDVLSVTSADAASVLGATVVVGADGSLSYDPDGLFEYLAAGESIEDTLSYTIADLAGATSSATVRVTVNGANDAPVATDDVIAPEGGASAPEGRLITFEGAGTPPNNVDGFVFEQFTPNSMFGVQMSAMVSASVGNDNAGGDGDADGAVRLADGGDFALKSLALASFFVEPTVLLRGYKDGVLVAETDPGDPLVLSAGYVTFDDFGTAWSSIDELRFYGSVDDPMGDFILLDNLLVELGGSSAASGHSEDLPLDIDVLANDRDVDASDVLFVSAVDAKSAMGATLRVNADGTLHYDPTEADDIQLLARGETAIDTFEYTVSDGHGGTSVASVSVALQGEDEPAGSPFASLTAPDVDLV